MTGCRLATVWRTTVVVGMEEDEEEEKVVVVVVVVVVVCGRVSLVTRDLTNTNIHPQV